jgi:predicted metal-dependent enzyme (double-stranded beta helix superfamily)
MWAVIGTYQGCEENRLFARANDGLEVVEEFQLRAGDVRVLDADAIHSVQITSDDYLGAVHVYGGDLLGVPRSSWDADGVEQVYASSGPKLFEVARHHEERLGRGLTSAEIVAFLAAARSG